MGKRRALHLSCNNGDYLRDACSSSLSSPHHQKCSVRALGGSCINLGERYGVKGVHTTASRKSFSRQWVFLPRHSASSLSLVCFLFVCRFHSSLGRFDEHLAGVLVCSCNKAAFGLGLVSFKLAGREAEWLRNLLVELPMLGESSAPVSLHCDSQAAIAVAKNSVYNGKMRHIRVRHGIVKQLLKNGVISLDFVRSKRNIADPLTKRLTRGMVLEISKEMGYDLRRETIAVDT